MVKKEPGNYPCQFCGEILNSRQARSYHERIACEKRPNIPPKIPDQIPDHSTNPPEQEPPEGPPIDTETDLDKNRREYAEKYGVSIPDPNGPDMEIIVPPSSEEDDHSVWIVIGLILFAVFTGLFWLFKDTILSFFGKKPPMRPPTSMPLGGVLHG